MAMLDLDTYKKEMILGWQGKDTLRIGDGPNNPIKGPFDGDHRAGMGSIPDDDWFTVDVIATKTFLELRVNGNQRYRRAPICLNTINPLRFFREKINRLYMALYSGNPILGADEQNKPLVENPQKLIRLT